MNKLINPTFIVSIMAGIKLILKAFGVELPDETFDTFVNGICAAITLFGIYMPHDKKVVEPGVNKPEQSS